MQQGRWVSYIYRYRNNAKCENAGFIKGQRMSSGQNGEASVRFQIGLKLYKKKACKCTVYLLYDENKAKYLTDIYLEAEERDAIMTRIELPWDNPLHDGQDIETYDGLFFRCGDGEVLTGLWNEYPVNPEQIVIVEEEMTSPEGTETLVGESEETTVEEAPSVSQGSAEASAEEAARVKEESVEALAEEGILVKEETEEISVEEAVSAKEETAERFAVGTMAEEAARVKEESAGEREAVPTQAGAEAALEDSLSPDACRNILNTYPKLPLFADSQFIECVKIVPHDIGKLAISNWKLGVNSFVSHGYYHYRYLMLGRVRFERGECVVIGVPGVFTNKEKYLANMFGFDTFVPVKKAKTLTGNFGYWVSEVLRE